MTATPMAAPADSTSPPPEGAEGAESADGEDTELAVPLTELAVIAAWLDVLASRGVLRLVGSIAHRDTVVAVDALSRYIRNVAGVAVLIGLVGVTAITMLHPQAVYDGVRRLIMGIFLGVFSVVLVVALVMPEYTTTILLVLIGIASASLLATTYATTAFNGRAPIEQRVVCALALVMSLAALTHVGFQVGTTLLGTDSGLGVARACRDITELAYFTMPVSLAIGLVVRREPRISPVRIVVSLALSVGVAVALRSVAAALPADFNVLLYGALHLEALDRAPDVVYAVLIGLAVGAGVLAVTSSVPSDRRLGWGSLLVTAAGAGPRAPLTLGMMLLGVASMSLALRSRRRAGLVRTRADAPRESTTSSATTARAASESA